jgi:hypothetical protein
MQRNRFDRAAKDMLRASLEPDGVFVSDANVDPDPQRADGWFTPDPTRPATRADLGLLFRMTTESCTLEPFHATPGENELSGCIRKLLNFRHVLSLRTPAAPLPRLWIISSGRPERGFEGFEFRPFEGWPAGVYRATRLLFTGMVITSELPRQRDTLLLRLMGAGPCLREAVVELAALPDDAREHALAIPVLSRCFDDIPTDPAKRTIEEEDFVTESQEYYEKWKREHEAIGMAKGLATGLAEGLRVIYEIRFGTMPPELKTVVEATKDPATLRAWLSLVETSPPEAFAAAVLASRAA